MCYPTEQESSHKISLSLDLSWVKEDSTDQSHSSSMEVIQVNTGSLLLSDNNSELRNITDDAQLTLSQIGSHLKCEESQYSSQIKVSIFLTLGHDASIEIEQVQ